MANNVEVGIRVGESLTILVTDPDTGAQMTMTLTADGMFIPAQPEPPDPGPEPIEGAAKWLAPLEATATSAETGPIVALTAWGGSGWGYSYRYTLNAAPQGVTIDADTGLLELKSALPLGDHNFGVVVTDRVDAALMQMFDFTLHVVQGNHKTYRPEDFANNFTNMRNRILSDQQADPELRATIQFAKGKTYGYSDNHWLTGIRHYRCEAVGNGANPILQCSNTTASPYDRGPLNIGAGTNALANIGDANYKARMALIADAEPGDTSVTMLNAGDGGRLKPGRWHVVMSYSQQLGGSYPPSLRWNDYVKVVSVDGAKVILDRPLNHAHRADYWEDPNDNSSIGKARIAPWEEVDGKTRCTERGHFVGLDFRSAQRIGFFYVEGHIHLLLDNCRVPDAQISMNKFVQWRSCTVTSDLNPQLPIEPDKLSEVLVLDKTDVQFELGGANGYAYVLFRDTKTTCLQICPRQFRAIRCTMDGRGDAAWGVPFGHSFNNLLEAEFSDTTFDAASGVPWCWGSAPRNGAPANWRGNTLVVPRSFGGFEEWLVWGCEGMMVFTGATVAQPGNYGRVDKIHASADASELLYDITWIKGSKPTSGVINQPQKDLRRITWLPGTRVVTAKWEDPSYVCMVGTPADRAFPEGID